MNAMLNIALNDLRIFFNERTSAILNLVVIPIVLSVMIGIANSPNTGPANAPTLPVDVIDYDNSAVSAQFVESIGAINDALIFCPLTTAADIPEVCSLDADSVSSVSPVETLATNRLQNQTSLALIIIPVGFASALEAGESVSVIYRSNEGASAPSYILQAVQAAAQQWSGAIVAQHVGMTVADTLPILSFPDEAARSTFAASIRDEAVILWAQNPVTVEVVRVSLNAADLSAQASGFTQSIPGMASMYVMFAILPAVGVIITERKTWTLQRLATLPIPRWQVLGGKVLGRFMLGMIQYAVVFAFGLIIGVRYGNDPVALLVMMVSFTLCITALALMLTGFLDNIAQAQGISLFLSLTLAPLGGAWWTLDIVPAWMRTLGHISPVAWVMDGYQQLIIFGGSLVDILPFAGVLLAMTAVFFLIGVRRFRFS